MIKTLEQLRQMRERGVSDLTSKLAQQKQLCQRYENNINALTTLSDSSKAMEASAVQMSNHSAYKRSIQRVINWQKQEQTLAGKKAENLQQTLVQAACQEKTVALVLQEQQAKQRLELSRKEQKITDNLSLQSWLRQRQS